MHAQSDIPAQKAALRERGAEARLALAEKAYDSSSRAICDTIAGLPEIAHADTISVYWPLLARREVDTRPLVLRLAADGRRVVLPIAGSLSERPTLAHAAFASEERLQPNRWGILEPQGERVGVEEIDAVVVPAICAGRNLHRLGYGRGFYDGFLARTSAPAVAAVFAACLVEAVPHEPHDVPLTAVVTEREIVRSTALTGRNTKLRRS